MTGNFLASSSFLLHKFLLSPQTGNLVLKTFNHTGVLVWYDKLLGKISTLNLNMQGTL